MSLFASTILAFEPNPHSFAVLQTNARLNPEMGLVPYNVGVGSDGTADFFFGGVSAATFCLAATVAAALTVDRCCEQDFCNGGGLGEWKMVSQCLIPLHCATCLNDQGACRLQINGAVDPTENRVSVKTWQ